MVFVSETCSCYAFTNFSFPAGNGPAAILSGTHEPGQFCFMISRSQIIMLGPASITSPISGTLFTRSNERTVNFAAKGLYVSRGYFITVNGVTVASVSSTNLGRATATLDLSSFPDGNLEIALIRSSDEARVVVQVAKDTSSFVSVSSASLTLASLQVRGSGEVGGRVVVTVQDSSASTPDVVSAQTVIDSTGTWTIGPLDLSSQADGMIRVTASIIDIYGNNAISIPVATSKDTTVNVAIAAPSNLQFVVSSARSTALTVSGFAETNARVVVSINDVNDATPAISSAS